MKHLLNMLVILAMVAPVMGDTLLVNEDFAPEPSWTKVSSGSGFYYNATNENMSVVTVRNGASDGYFTATGQALTQDDTFTFSWDYKFTAASGYPYVGAGLFDNIADTTLSGDIIPFLYYTGAGTNFQLLHSPQLSARSSAFSLAGNTFYTFKTTWDGDAETMTTLIKLQGEADINAVITYTTTHTGLTFSNDQYGIRNACFASASSGDLQGQVDNMVLSVVPEPATMTLLVSGAVVGLLKRRK